MSYNDLINIESFEKKDNFNPDRWWVAFFCKNCNRIVETKRPDSNWYIFICNECNNKNISIWTKEWLIVNYKIKRN